MVYLLTDSWCVYSIYRADPYNYYAEKGKTFTLKKIEYSNCDEVKLCKNKNHSFNIYDEILTLLAFMSQSMENYSNKSNYIIP